MGKRWAGSGTHLTHKGARQSPDSAPPAAHFDAVGQPTSDHDQELLARRHSLPLAHCLLRRLVPIHRTSGEFSPAIECFATVVCPSAVQVSLTPLAETGAGERSVKISSRWPYSQKARRSGWRASVDSGIQANSDDAKAWHADRFDPGRHGNAVCARLRHLSRRSRQRRNHERIAGSTVCQSQGGPGDGARRSR